ncbi:glycosyltransferase [Ancylobacter sp. WKF20]|uniref:glycosyltransferase n=1 Tax=Ancylobacter sp. WKF20 TaxID=3039801 RepID=UPI0024341E26|nr:glycosyltransferase [Ancylobacter sp. WKF20]WGD30262.1 glycosyltransferase [Ancylobacter sp. WKF20]
MRPQLEMRVPGDDLAASLPVELAGLAGTVEPGDLAYAQRRARLIGVGADEVLIAAGVVTPDQAAQASARRLGIAFTRLDGVEAPPSPRPSPADLVALLHSGILRTAPGRLVLAARGDSLRQLAARLAARPALREGIALTTPERLAAHVRRRHGPTLARQAAYGLIERSPRLSAGTLGPSRLIFALAALILALVPLLLHSAPAPLAIALALGIGTILLGWNCLRLAAVISPPEPPDPPWRADRSLPRYTLIIPLYREARVVAQLVEALLAIDYPREKLQVLLVVEADDGETARALAGQRLPAHLEIITAPGIGPRTKPKALNAALPFARGTLIGVYDAEDQPDPLQLRRVCTRFFLARDDRLGCVQAQLAIDNLDDGWITRQFAAEYAGHFDVLLPMLGASRIPFPLGGTSNHFRRAALEAVGGWDPHNVTEDADLGLRLARLGWRTEVTASTTDEEAPRRFAAWLRQRTRWYKGWMQTLLVHGRQPQALLREAGCVATIAFLFLMVGGVGAALVHPFFLIALLRDITLAQVRAGSPTLAVISGLGSLVLIIGYVSALMCTGLGMHRRGMGRIAGTLALMPLYWLMMSLAAWRAVGQLVIAPEHWEKTDHGLARTSRRRPRRRRLGRVTNSGADQPRLQPADA